MSVEEVKENNKRINEAIEKIVAYRREKGLKIEDPTREDGFDQVAKKIFELETKKVIGTYEAEFAGKYTCQGAGIDENGNGVVNLKEPEPGKTADCFGGTKGLTITTGMQGFIDTVIKGSMTKLGFSVDKGGVYFSSDGNQYDGSNIEKVEGKIPLVTDGKFDGSQKDQMDFFAYLYANGGIDMDWVLGCLAHEGMHTFGTVGGNDFLKEGTTEQLTREMCEKYGIYMAPTSHTVEANLVRDLEMVVGRDKVISAGMTNEAREASNIDRYANMATEFETKLGLSEGSFKRFSDTLSAIYEIQLGNVKTSDGKKISHKQDPYFYRKLYSEDWTKLLSDAELSKLMTASGIDSSRLDEVKQNGIDIFQNGKPVKSFGELVAPIKEHIKEMAKEMPEREALEEKGLGENEIIEVFRKGKIQTNSSPDLSQVIEAQQEEIEALQEIAKEYGIELPSLDAKTKETDMLNHSESKVTQTNANETTSRLAPNFDDEDDAPSL